jgi:hypothetical protein
VKLVVKLAHLGRNHSLGGLDVTGASRAAISSITVDEPPADPG